MEALLFYTDELLNGKNVVNRVHYIPEEVPDSERTNALLVTDYKEPPMLPGKMPVLYVDRIDMSWSYDYIDLPPTVESEIQELKRTNETLMSALSEVTMYVGRQDLTIEQQNQAISELSILIVGGNT